MKIGTEDKKKLIAVSVLGPCAILAAIFLYLQLFGGPSTPPPPPPVVATTPTVVVPAAAKTTAVTAAPGYAVAGTGTKVATTSGQLDPTLHMEAMLVTESLVYSGTGRNIFAAGPGDEPPPVKFEKAIFKARPDTPPPPVQRTAQTPAPPPINLKFFGTATNENTKVRRALLVNGDDVYVVSVGDVVQRRYRVLSITATSILVEDIPNSNKQTLPLIAQ